MAFDTKAITCLKKSIKSKLRREDQTPSRQKCQKPSNALLRLYEVRFAKHRHPKQQLMHLMHLTFWRNCNTPKELASSLRLCVLTVGLPEIWNILEIQKMKICSEVRNFMGKMNFQSKCAEVSWLLRYSVFSVFTKISWPIFLSKLWKNWAGYNFFGDSPEFGLLHRFQKWSNFWKSIIQQLTYEQYAIWL